MQQYPPGLSCDLRLASSMAPPSLSIYIQPKCAPGLFPPVLLHCCPLLYFKCLPRLPGAVHMFLVVICVFVSGLLWALWRRFLAELDQDLSFRELMEELRPRQVVDKQLKQQFLDALQANNGQEVMRILHTGKLDIDTVMEVEDPNMVLASYKQGTQTNPVNLLHSLGCRPIKVG